MTRGRCALLVRSRCNRKALGLRPITHNLRTGFSHGSESTERAVALLARAPALDRGRPQCGPQPQEPRRLLYPSRFATLHGRFAARQGRSPRLVPLERCAGSPNIHVGRWCKFGRNQVTRNDGVTGWDVIAIAPCSQDCKIVPMHNQCSVPAGSEAPLAPASPSAAGARAGRQRHQRGKLVAAVAQVGASSWRRQRVAVPSTGS